MKILQRSLTSQKQRHIEISEFNNIYITFCLTSVIGRELVFSTWYGRIQCCEVKKVNITLLDDFVLSSMWSVPPYFLLLVEAFKLTRMRQIIST